MSISNTQWHNRSRSFLLPDQLWDTGFCGSLKVTVNTSRDPKSFWGFSPRSWLSCLCFRGRKNTRLKAFLAQSLWLRWTSQLKGTPYLELHLPQPASSTASFGFLPFINTGIAGSISQELATWALQFKRKIIWIQSMKNTSRNLLFRFMWKQQSTKQEPVL